MDLVLSSAVSDGENGFPGQAKQGLQSASQGFSSLQGWTGTSVAVVVSEKRSADTQEQARSLPRGPS